MLSCYSLAGNDAAITAGGYGYNSTAVNSLGVIQSLFIATARYEVSEVYATARNSRSVFMKGYAENCEVRTSNSAPWEWRRIVFRMKGGALRANLALFDDNGSVGYRRRQTIISDGSAAGVAISAQLFGHVFDGTVTDDWTDPMQAKVTSQNVTIMSDTKRFVRSGNDNGVLRNYKTYVPINKNLRYYDGEVGAIDISGAYSAEGNSGCGDVYIFDTFKPWINTTDGGQLFFTPQACLYWHEK